MGCVGQATEQQDCGGRMSLLTAGCPHEATGVSLDRFGGSGPQAVDVAAIPLELRHARGVRHEPVHGGGDAPGHPLSATGGMLTGAVLDELEPRDETTGPVTLCIGRGMGITTTLDRI